MHRESILIVLGVLIFIAPYLGLPYSWLMVLLPAFGLLVLAVGLSIRMKRRTRAAITPPEPHDAHPAV